MSCSPFHIKFNKVGKRGDPNRVVKLTVNSKDVDLSMKLGGAGEAFFVERTKDRNAKSLARSRMNENQASEISRPDSVYDADSRLQDGNRSEAQTIEDGASAAEGAPVGEIRCILSTILIVFHVFQ
jgi:phosphatidate phosphatase PAH1